MAHINMWPLICELNPTKAGVFQLLIAQESEIFGGFSHKGCFQCQTPLQDRRSVPGSAVASKSHLWPQGAATGCISVNVSMKLQRLESRTVMSLS